MTSEEFGLMSPRHFCLLMDRREEEHRRADLRMGILASLTANINRSKDAEPFTPEMFMPGYQPKPQTLDDMSRALRTIKANTEAINHGK